MTLRSRRPVVTGRGGLGGYRAMAVVAVLVVLVIILGLTGAFQRLLCRADVQTCAAVPEAVTDPNPKDPGQLPAATDEKAVDTTTGAGVPARSSVLAGRAPVAPAGQVLSLGAIWGADAQGGTTPFLDTTVLLPLDGLACGAPGKEPCDTWAGLSEDTYASVTHGADRLANLGLQKTTTSAPGGSSTTVLRARPDGSLAAASGGEVAYTVTSDGISQGVRETWTWRDGDLAVVYVEARTGTDARPTSLVVTDLRRAGGAGLEEGSDLERTTLALALTSTSAGTAASWLAALRAQETDPRAELLAPAASRGGTPDSAGDLVRALLSVARTEATLTTQELSAADTVGLDLAVVVTSPQAAGVEVTQERSEPLAKEDGS